MCSHPGVMMPSILHTAALGAALISTRYHTCVCVCVYVCVLLADLLMLCY